LRLDRKEDPRLSKYRRIEISAYQRRVTVVSGEWRPGEVFDPQPTQTDDGVSLSNPDSCEAIAPDSPEGQSILVEAVRTLQRRLLPESRAALCESSKDADAESKEFNLVTKGQ